jgi:hypothetical protein
LIERLFTVLKNSKKLEEFKYDPEQTADLYYQVRDRSESKEERREKRREKREERREKRRR